MALGKEGRVNNVKSQRDKKRNQWKVPHCIWKLESLKTVLQNKSFSGEFGAEPWTEKCRGDEDGETNNMVSFF